MQQRFINLVNEIIAYLFACPLAIEYLKIL